MAKRKTDDASTSTIDAATAATVVQVVQDITGCGRIEADTRVRAMDDKLIAQIADLESAGKRPEIVALLY